MKITANTIEEYVEKLPGDRKVPFQKLLDTIRENIADGFTEAMQYDMPSWNVSLEDYPSGYHCTKDTPLPFLSLGNQKNYIAFYHMGMYAKPSLKEWFEEEYLKYAKRKLDMGKSCVRFKYMDDIPYELIGQLCQKMTAKEWISIYENATKK